LMEGAGASDTLLIGDSNIDLETARAAGVRLCLARYGFGFARVSEDAITPGDILIDEPSELLAALV
jgi:phosphoglycolate phosphatase-like HAD superfamily hydrolase